MSRWVAVKNASVNLPLVKYDVSLYYWWPGRTFEQWDEFPPAFKSLVRRCERGRSKYLVYAEVTVPVVRWTTEPLTDEEVRVWSYARCMDIDLPRKVYGRDRALGTLKQKLLKIGYTVEETVG